MKDDKYITALLENDRVLLEEMYQAYLPMIVVLVKQQNGDREDARDVFQDGLMVLYDKVEKGGFVLTSSLKTYLYSVCRFIWLRKLKKKKPQPVTNEQLERLIDEQDIETSIIEEERYLLYKAHLNQLGEKCQTILRLFFRGEKMRAIAQQMDYTEKFAKNKKYLCTKQLLKMIQSTKEFKEL